jgi:hypothetical protein
MRLPADAYKLCTTVHPEKFEVGSEVVNRAKQQGPLDRLSDT